MKPCEVCAQYGIERKGPFYRVAETWLGRMGLDLCRMHANALAVRTLRREVPVALHTHIHVDNHGRPSVHGEN